MEGVAAPTSVGVACAKHMDSLEREVQGGARRYVSRHRMSPNAWSSPTLRPSAEAESTSSASVLSPHKPMQRTVESLFVYCCGHICRR
jgi:hypothetical protein